MITAYQQQRYQCHLFRACLLQLCQCSVQCRITLDGADVEVFQSVGFHHIVQHGVSGGTWQLIAVSHIDDVLFLSRLFLCQNFYNLFAIFHCIKQWITYLYFFKEGFHALRIAADGSHFTSFNQCCTLYQYTRISFASEFQQCVYRTVFMNALLLQSAPNNGRDIRFAHFKLRKSFFCLTGDYVECQCTRIRVRTSVMGNEKGGLLPLCRGEESHTQ